MPEKFANLFQFCGNLIILSPMGKEFPKYAKVAVDAPIYDLLTYGVPPEFADVVSPGWRVMVPLGRRLATGFVVDILAEPDIAPETIKPIADFPDDEPLLTPQILKLCRFVAQYYVAPPGMAISAALPLGAGMNTKQILSLVRIPDYYDRLHPTQQKILNLLREGPVELKEIANKLGRGVMYHIRQLERNGLVGRRYEYRQRAVPKTVEVAALAPDIDAETIDSLESRAPNQAGILRYLAANGPTRATFLRKLFGAGSFRALVEKGFVRITKQEVFRSATGWLTPRSEVKELTPSQKRALKEIKSALSAGETKPILIYGVTGSGKTLVYLEAAKMVRTMGKGVLVLVPEVALTPQMWGVLREYFGEEVAVLHSYLSPGERYDTWRRIKRGELKIVLGARSAIFAPIGDLGLIVVDEEHENSYKQGQVPYYNARDLAVVRGKYENALVILGSATPSMESYYNAVTGKYRLIKMTERVPGAKLPEVKVVDLKKVRPRERIFTPIAKNEILKRAERGEQTISLLNRRGYSTSLICPDCGYVPRCPNCDVTLTYHRVGDELKCHWCDYVTPAPDRCPNCGSENFKHRGKGTQKIELMLYDFVPREKVIRIDSDAVSRKGSLTAILEKFSSTPGAVLVGTQMIAKGHDFPDVTLVVVVDADVGMAIPDFRAGEKTFQLLSQVAGRAGRGEKPGLVIIQTRHPDEPAVQFAIRHDYENFFKHTLARRQVLGYPPFSRIVRILASSEDSTAAEESVRKIYRLLLSAGIEGIKVLSPTKPPLGRLKREYRWHLIVKSRDIRALLPFLHQLARANFKGVKLKIDVDPYDMM